MKLTDFKKTYEELQKKYNLPSFEQMNNAFEIGKIKRDSGNMLRDIRRITGEKISYYMRLMEVMINPSQAPPAFLMLLKEINKDDKKMLDSVFSAFMQLEIDSYKLNIESTDKDEAEFISKMYKTWNENKSDLAAVINILDKNWKQTSKSQKQNRDYFN